MKKSLLLVLCLLFAFVFVGCRKNPAGPDNPENPVKELVYSDGTELRLGVCHNNTKTAISYQDSSITGTGLKLADGKTYQTGDLKPVWAELQNVLKVKFTDVYSGQSSAEKEYKAWKALNFEGVDVVVGNASDMAEDGKTGKIVNLADYIDYMPNLKKFLDENPIVYLSIISDTDTGAMYYAPYFDGNDDIEKYYLMRTDWLEKLLDGEGKFAAATTDTFGDICKEVKYTPYMQTSGTLKVQSLTADGSGTQDITKNYDTKFGNIADYMNKNVKATTTGVELVNMLRDYIDAAYGGIYGTKRSDLFAGNAACWDADELVALLRCVVTNTFALTGQNETKVTGLFPRESALNRTSDLFSLVSLFGARGYESRNDYLYFNANGELCDGRNSVEFAEGINKLNQLYSEGLILQDFDKTTSTIYKTMYQQNLGFMIYDYCQTQTLYNNDATTLEKCPDFNLAPVINPVAKWYDGSNMKDGKDEGTYMRFTESWRSVKTSGWCIPTTCTGEKLQAALKLFDYMYSKEGAELMSYGPAAWRSGKTISYKGQDIPELSAAALDELWTLQGGNYTNYARMILGSTLPIGFVKDQGMEYQCTTQGGRDGAEIVSNAIAKGVLKHVSPSINTNLYYTIVPTTLPTSAAQDTILETYGAISGSSSLYSKTKGQYNIYIDVIKNGFGSKVELSNTYITVMPESGSALVKEYYVKLGGAAYVLIQQNAWEDILDFYNAKLAK